MVLGLWRFEKMKNYANRKEIELFTLILAFQEYLKIFKDCEFLSEQEVKNVSKALKSVNEMSESVKERLGYVFLKKIKGFLDCNTLGFYAKGILRDKVVNNIDDDIITELLNDSGWAMDCFDCDKEDFKNCRCYKIFVEMGKHGNGKEMGCPFR